MRRDAFYYCVKFFPPYCSNIVYERFLILSEAIQYLKEKTGLICFREESNKLCFVEGVEIIDAAQPKDIAERILANNVNVGVDLNHVFCFLREKVFQIPNAPDSLIIDLLKQTDIMDQEIRIMDYKLKHLDRFPEMRILLYDEKAIKTH